MDNNGDLEKDNDIVNDDVVVDSLDDNNEHIDNLSDETFTYRVDNNNVKNDYSKNDFNNDRSILYIVIGVCILFVIILLLIFFANRGKSSTSEYSEIESKMVSASKLYYEKNVDLLPIIDGASSSVSANTLIENSFLKPFSEMVSTGVSCTGEVSVYKIGDDYSFFPYLNCGSAYESLKFSRKIIDSGVVTSGDGLYKDGNDYIFRGEYPSNYVKFDDKIWRIVKINSDGSIKLIYGDNKVEKTVWDDRYNSSREGYVGINDFRVSRILDYLKNSYENNLFVSKNNKHLLVKNNWCIGKISQDNSPIADLNLCSDTYDDLYIGLINVYEILFPSIAENCVNVFDIECTNYNYFFRINSGWTLNANSDKSYVVFSSTGGAISNKNASLSSVVRPVININSNVLYKSGTGTVDDPYTIGN